MLINIGLMRQLKAPGGGPSDYSLYLPFTNSLSTGATWSRTTNAWNPETGAVAPHNLLTYSNTFSNGFWTKGITTVAANQNDPNGTTTAFLLYPNTSGIGCELYEPFTHTSGSVYVASLYVKTAGLQWISLGTDNASQNKCVWFDVINGVKGTESSGYTGAITSVGNGWYRIQVNYTGGGANVLNYFDISMSNTNGGGTITVNGTNGFYVYGAQLNQYSLTDYVPTTSTAVYAPRYVTGKKGTGLFLERSSTNKCTCYSVPRADSLGAELITNAADRDFSSDTGFWSVKTGSSTISGGTANIIGNTDQGIAKSAVSGISLGKYYTISLKIVSVTSGTLKVWIGIGSRIITSADVGQTLTFTLQCVGDTGVYFYAASAGTNISIDDVTVKEAIDYVGTKAYHNGTAFQNPITSMTLSGDTAATLSIVTDQTAIDAAIAAEALAPTGMLPALLQAKSNGYKVYKLEHLGSSGSAIVTISGSPAAGSSSWSLTCKAGQSTGSSAQLLNAGFAASGINFTNTTWAAAKKSNITVSAGDTLAVVCNAQKSLYFLAPQLEEQTYATSQILCLGAATSRSAETLTYNTSGIIGSPGTVSGWWKPEAVAAGTVQTIWSSYTGAADYTALKYNGVIAYIEKAMTGQTTEYVTFPITLPTTSFTHFAILINSNGTMGLYVNGVSAQSGLGGELFANSGFTGGGDSWNVTDASISFVNNQALYTNTPSGVSLYQGLALNKNKAYQHSFTIVSITAGAFNVRSFPGIPSKNSEGICLTTGFPTSSNGNEGISTSGITSATVDDVSLKEIYNSTSTAFAPVIASTMQIGSINNGSQADGTLDEFYFYNRVLTEAEIGRLYGSTITYPDAWTDQLGDYWTDQSGNIWTIV